MVSILVKKFIDKFTRPVQHIDTRWKKFLEENKNKIDILGRIFVLLFKPLQLLEKDLDRLNLGRKEYDGMRGLAGGYYFIGEKV